MQAIAMRGSEVLPAERIQLLRSAAAEFCSQDASIEEDPLYRTVSDLTHRAMQVQSTSTSTSTSSAKST